MVCINVVEGKHYLVTKSIPCKNGKTFVEFIGHVFDENEHRNVYGGFFGAFVDGQFSVPYFKDRKEKVFIKIHKITGVAQSMKKDGRFYRPYLLGTFELEGVGAGMIVKKNDVPEDITGKVDYNKIREEVQKEEVPVGKYDDLPEE